MQTEEELFQALRSWRLDLQVYTSANLKIKTKAADLIPFQWNDGQRLVDQKLEEQSALTGKVRAIILKARQTGISTYVAARNFRKLHLWPRTNAFVIADKKGRGSILFAIYERYYQNLPDWLKPATRYSAKGQHILFDTPDGKGLGSELQVETAEDKNAGRSATIQALHVSELAFWQYPDETFLSLIQAVPPDSGEVIIESTANGVGNYFHAMWLAAEAGDNGYVPIFLPWWFHKEYELKSIGELETAAIVDSVDPAERFAQDVGYLWEGKIHKLRPTQLAWRRMAIRDLCGGDERLFRQEYPATPEEAFLASGNCFFDEDPLKKYQQVQKVPIARGNLVQSGQGIVFAKADRGYLRLWDLPRNEVECPVCKTAREGLDAGYPEGPPCSNCDSTGLVPARYVIGADTASGKLVSSRSTGTDLQGERGGRDFSCADVFECNTRAFVAQLHGRMAPEVFAEAIYRLGHFYSSPGPLHSRRAPSMIGVERNHSSGQTVIQWLRDHAYGNLFQHRLINRRTQRVTQSLGWVTNEETRMPMLDTLAKAIREEEITYPNPQGIQEMFTFIRGDDGKPEGQEGCHDDRVIAAAISLQMARYSPGQPRGSTPEYRVEDTPSGM